MAPAVPFALLGVVQIVAVATWIGLAGAATLPRLRRPVTPVFVAGALALAAADALTATQFGSAASDGIAWLRLAGLALVAVGVVAGAGQSLVLPLPGAVGGVVVPLGAATPTPAALAGVAGAFAALAAWLRSRRDGGDRLLGALFAGGFLLTGLAAGLAAPAGDSGLAALAVLAARSAATLCLVAAVARLARTTLVGKIVGAILAGVVALAAGAVSVVGNGVADEVQSGQSQRLLQVAQSEQQGLRALATRASLFAEVVGQCPSQPKRCEAFLTLFSDQHDFFAVLVPRGRKPQVVAHEGRPVSSAALLQLAGSPVVQAALRRGASTQGPPNGPLVLTGSPPTLTVVAAVPVRPRGTTDLRVRPVAAAVYGIGVGDAYLGSLRGTTGYDVTVIAENRILASSLGASGRDQVLAAARSAHVDAADPTVRRVVPAEASAPTAAFVAVTAAGNDDVRIATLALSQPANEALRAQRSVLQRLFLTTLVALAVVALLAVPLAGRIAEPVRRLTVAAGRVRRGDLDATTTVASRDEVGSLGRAFDAMTESLRRLTADLRQTAAQESALRGRLETIVESMSDGLVATDGQGLVTGANATAARLLGRDADEVVGRPLRDVVTVEDAEGRSVVDAVPDRTSVEGELVRADGERLPVRFAVAPLADGEGRVVVIGDRTREREVERMKTEFLANVSHELRTPLTPIRGYAEMIARRPDLSRPQVESFLDEILSSTARMSRAVELLVDVAALEGGRIAAERSTLGVRALVDDRLAAWRARYPERAADFRRRVAARLPAVDVELHWVNRALDELADNAVKYSAPGSPITLTAALDDDGRHVRVGVRDTGPGFDVARAHELVEDFAQADASETRRVGGMGLGLGFVSRVAARFGLELTVESEPGRGSEFTLVLPAASRPPRPRSAERAQTRPQARSGR